MPFMPVLFYSYFASRGAPQGKILTKTLIRCDEMHLPVVFPLGTFGLRSL